MGPGSLGAAPARPVSTTSHSTSCIAAADSQISVLRRAISATTSASVDRTSNAISACAATMLAAVPATSRPTLTLVSAAANRGSPKRVRARVEHALSRLKCWKILRDYRRAATTLHDTASGIAYLHNIDLGH